jgi:hypothetical protein
MNVYHENKLRILTWNVGVFQPLTYLKLLGIKLKNHHIEHEFFYKHNGPLVSEYITKLNPDIIILQEILSLDDVDNIPILQFYPHKKLLKAWGDNNILIASRMEFSHETQNFFHILHFEQYTVIPLHLNSFSAEKRLHESSVLSEIVKTQVKPVIAIGDTNIWKRNNRFLFKNDKKAYSQITSILPEASSYIVSTHYFGFGIDKVFTSPGMITECFSDKERGVFMDHYPVYVDVEKD